MAPFQQLYILAAFFINLHPRKEIFCCNFLLYIFQHSEASKKARFIKGGANNFLISINVDSLI
jgi:hypothetical protein